MDESKIVKKWRDQSGVYASIDRNPSGQNKIILVKDNIRLIRELDSPITTELLDRLLDDFKSLALDE